MGPHLQVSETFQIYGAFRELTSVLCFLLLDNMHDTFLDTNSFI